MHICDEWLLLLLFLTLSFQGQFLQTYLAACFHWTHAHFFNLIWNFDAGVKCFTLRNMTYFSYCFPLTLPHCHCSPHAGDIAETPGKAVSSVSSLNLHSKIMSIYHVCWLYLAESQIQSLTSPISFVSTPPRVCVLDVDVNTLRSLPLKAQQASVSPYLSPPTRPSPGSLSLLVSESLSLESWD